MESLLPLLVLVLLLGFVSGLFLVRQKRMTGGFWPWEAASLRREGLPGRAVVLSRVTLGSANMGRHLREYEAVLEVHVPERAPYRVPAVFVGYWAELDETTQEGASIPVFVDRANPERVLVDFDTIVKAKRASWDAEIEARRKRQRELLDDGER